MRLPKQTTKNTKNVGADQCACPSKQQKTPKM